MIMQVGQSYIDDANVVIDQIARDEHLTIDDRLKLMAALVGIYVGSFSGLIEGYSRMAGNPAMTDEESFARAMALINKSVVRPS